MLFIFTAQVHDWLVQNPETAFVHSLEDGFGGVGLFGRFIVCRVVYLHAVAVFVAFLFPHFAGSYVGAPNQLFGFRRVFRDGRNADGYRQRYGTAVDVEQVIIHGLANALAQHGHAFFVAGHAHHAEGIIAQAGQGQAVTGIVLEQGGNVAQQQVCAGNANLVLGTLEVVQGDVSQGSGFVGFAGLGDGAGQFVHQVLTVVQAGEQVLAADLLQLFFQFGITVFRLQHNLGAGFAIVGGGRDRHGNGQFLVIAAAGGTVHGHAVFALFGKGFHEFLVPLLALRRQGVQDRDADQVVYVVVAEEFHVRLVGVDMHATVEVGNGILGAFQQQLATLLGFAQVGLESSAPAPVFQCGKLTLGDQNQQVFVFKGYCILGAGPDDVDGTLAIVFFSQQNKGNVLVHPFDGSQGIIRAELLLQVPGQEQIPVGVFQGVFEVFFGCDSVRPGRFAGVAQQADHGFCIVLGGIQNQKVYGRGFFLHSEGSASRKVDIR